MNEAERKRHQQGYSSLIYDRPGRAPTGMPRLKNMPNPHKKKKRKKKAAPARATTTQATTRTRYGPSQEQRSQQAAEQARDQEGKFAENPWNKFWSGQWWNQEPHGPTRLKKRPTLEARSFGEERETAAPGRRPARRPQKKRKKPYPERGFIGRVAGLFNGDYSRWKLQQNRLNAKYRAMADGTYEPPKRRRRRRRRTSTAAPRRGAQRR